MARGTLGTRIFFILLGSLLCLAGGSFTLLMWESYTRARLVDRWAIVPATVIESDVESRRDDPDWPLEMPQEYRFHVRYAYQWEGRDHESERLQLRGAPWGNTPEEAEHLAEKFPVGQAVDCHVNPKNPAESVLVPESRAAGYSLWFPLMITAGGLVLLGRAIALRREKE